MDQDCSIMVDGREYMVSPWYGAAFRKVKQNADSAASFVPGTGFSPGTGPSSTRPRNSQPVTAPHIRQRAMYSDRPRRSRDNRKPALPSTSSLPSSTRPRNSKPVTAPHIRQSAMYSDRPRRSRGNRERALPPTSSVAKNNGDLGSNSVGPAISDTSKFELLSMNDRVPALDSTCSDVGADLHDTSVVAPSVTEDDPSWSEKVHEIKEYLKEHTFDSWEAVCEYFYSAGLAVRPDAGTIDNEAMSEHSSQESSDEQPVLASERGRYVPAQGRCSRDQIVQNGMKWMREEVMVAFEKYLERQDDLKGCEYKLDELKSQCFSVENYNHIFHHYNFTVKMKGVGSKDWTSALYFAEVKEIFGRKMYFCSLLEQDENGHCYACKNQGIDDLKHPVVGAYDIGSPDTVFPYMYHDYSDDEFDEFAPVKLDDEADEEYIFEDELW